MSTQNGPFTAEAIALISELHARIIREGRSASITIELHYGCGVPRQAKISPQYIVALTT